MDTDSHELAIAFCRLIEAPDLLAWLRVPPDAPGEAAIAALKEQRRRLQGMQANPKYREPALFLIKHYRAIEAVLQDPEAHLREVRQRQESEKLPLLELVIDGLFADGVVTEEELAFLREQAGSLGISVERLEALVEARAKEQGVKVAPAPPLPSGLKTVNPRRTLPPPEMRGAAGKGWWDARLTKVLLEAIPPTTRALVDVACGLGWSAHTLLPHLPKARWIGVDEGDVEVTARSLRAFADRVTVRGAAPTSLPLADGSVDVVLSAMTMQRFPDTRPVLAEMRRVLEPGGRVVLVEPDGLGQQFWFDGDLTAFNVSFRNLCAEVDRLLARAARNDDPDARPGIALGPRMGRRLVAAGLTPSKVVVHAVQDVAWESFSTTSRRLRAHFGAMTKAAALPDDAPAVRAVAKAIADLEASRRAEDMGLGGHVLPAFVVVATR